MRPIEPSMRSLSALAEQVAVAPIALQAETLGVGKRRADAVVTQLALADLDIDRDVAAGVQRVGLA